MSSPAPKTLLLVDDNESLLIALEYNLKQAGYSVIKAVDGVEALNAVREHTPDIVVSDIEMPEMDGIELCRRLRTIPEHAETPFIFLTAHGETEEKVRGLRSGADDYIVKPFEIEELVARLDLYFEKRRKRRHSPQLSGKLEEISIFDVMQFLDLADKEGTLHISRNGTEGSVTVKGGLVMDAVYGQRSGEDALVELLQLPSGVFRYEAGEVAPGGLAQPVNVAMMDATKLMDERNNLSAFVPPEDSMLLLREDVEAEDSDIEAVCRCLQESPRTASQVAAAAGLSEVRATVAIAKLIRARAVYPAEVTRVEAPSDFPEDGPAAPAREDAERWEDSLDLGLSLPAVEPAPQPPEPRERTEPEPPPPPAAPAERPDPIVPRLRGREAAAQPKTRKLLFAFTDESGALQVLSHVAEAYRSEKPKGFKKTGVDFQRVQIHDGLLHIFSAPGEARFSFLWEPMLLTADAAVFVASSLTDLEHLKHFADKASKKRSIPFAVVTANRVEFKGVDIHRIESGRDVLNLFHDLLGFA